MMERRRVEVGDAIIHRCPSMRGPRYYTDHQCLVTAVLPGEVLHLRRLDGTIALGQRRVTLENPYGWIDLTEDL